MPRKYTKRSDYWKKFRKTEQPIENLLSSEAEDFNPELIGDSIYETVEASRLSEPTRRTSKRNNRVTINPTKNRFQNIKDGLLPFEYSKDSVSVKRGYRALPKGLF